MADFKKAFDITRTQFEGGYANVAVDRGGETYAGISRKYNPDWQGWTYIDFLKRTSFRNGIPHNKHFPDIEYLVVKFYNDLWNKNRLNEINSQMVATLVFDYLVHSSTRGIKNIQRVLGVTADGIIGPITIAAINARNPNELYKAILQERQNFLEELLRVDSTQEVFREGWKNRISFLSTLYNPQLNIGIIGIAILILMLIFANL